MFRTLRYLRTPQAYRSVGASSLPCCSAMRTQGAAHGSGGAPPDFPQKHVKEERESAPTTRGGGDGGSVWSASGGQHSKRKSPRSRCRRLLPFQFAKDCPSVLVCFGQANGSHTHQIALLPSFDPPSPPFRLPPRLTRNSSAEVRAAEVIPEYERDAYE